MPPLSRCVPHASRRTPLAACFASIFALSAPAAAIADTWIVNSCDEDSHATAPGPKTGTLRYALANATSPAIIDMAGLAGAHACPGNSIVLSKVSGQLATYIGTLTVFAPGSGVLKIDASALGGPPVSYGDLRVLAHYGNGKLTIHSLGITGGHVTHSSPAYGTSGGCIFSGGDVELDGVSVSSCYSSNQGSYNAAKGGGVYTLGALTLNNSSVTGSHASAQGAGAFGGGVYSAISLTLVNGSSINQNYVSSLSSFASGGGAYSKGDVTLLSSTISQNTATSTSAVAYASGGGLYTRGDLSLSDASVSFNSAGSQNGKALGGGAFVRGGAGAYFSAISNNSATSTNNSAAGGGAYVIGTLSLTNSNLQHNTLSAESGSATFGGGAKAVGGFSAEYSTIDQNSAAGLGFGGAIYSNGSGTITNSTISNNSSGFNIGGMDFFGGGNYANKTLTITNSTISGNSAAHVIGGLYADAGTVDINNSTIAFNTAASPAASAPGLALAAKTYPAGITLQSSILSNNTYGSTEVDISTGLVGPAIAGSNNLIRVAAAGTQVPVDTLTGCPVLGPLRDNGGLTMTHALLSTSPAIDTGNSSVVRNYDQRGSAATNGVLDYLRISGAKPDIGAYEVQQNDIVFNVSFEGCP